MTDLNKTKIPNIAVSADQLMPTSVLEAQLVTAARKPEPVGEQVLLTEVGKLTGSEVGANLKSSPIDTEIKIPTQKLEFKSDSPTANIPQPTQLNQPPEVIVKVVTVPIEKPVQTATNIATSGNIGQTILGQTVTNNSTLINRSAREIMAATEREVIKSSSATANTAKATSENSKLLVNSILKEGASILSDKEPISSFESTDFSKLEDSIMAAYLPSDFKKELTSAGVKLGGIDSVLTAAEKVNSGESAKSGAIKNLKDDLASVKSGKLADSNSLKQILTPDKTLEKSVTKLTRELPESINNLSSSFSTFSPQSSNITNVTNEGTRIDQSSTVNSTRSERDQMKQSGEAQTASQNQAGFNQNEFYLQAIYAALVSGKIRVKIENV